MILMYFSFKYVTALFSSRWYFGKIKRIEAEKKLLLQQNEHGAFLIRDSESRRNDFSLSVRDGDTVKHYRIRWQMFAILTEMKNLFFLANVQILLCSYRYKELALIRQLDDGGFFIARRTTFRSLQELVG